LENALEEILSLLFFLVGLESDIKDGEHLEDGFLVVLHNVSAESDDWFHDELNEASLELSSIISNWVSLPFLGFGIMEVITPKFLHHLIVVNLELLSIDSCELGEGKGPSEKSRTKSDGSLDWVYLLGVSHIISFVG